MLADDDAAAGHQGIGGLALSHGIIPGVGVLHVHVGLGDLGLDAQQEGGVAADHLGIGERAHVAHIGVGDGAGVHQLLELHAGHHAGDVAGLIGVGEDVLVVVQAGGGGQVAGAGHEGHIGILAGGLLHVHLMAVGVGEDDVAALLRQVHGGVIAGLVLGDVVAEDHLGVGGIIGVGGDAQPLAGGGEAGDVGLVIAGVDVVDADQADLHVLGGDAGGLLFRAGGLTALLIGGGLLIVAAAGRQAQDHGKGQQQGQELLHSAFLLKINGLDPRSLQGTKGDLPSPYCHHTGLDGKIQPDFCFFSLERPKKSRPKEVDLCACAQKHP